MRTTAALLAVTVGLVIAGCSQLPKEPTARAYSDPPELKACNDSLESFAGTGSASDFEVYKKIYEHFIQQYPNSTVLHRDFQSLFDGFDHEKEKVEYYRKLYDENPSSAMYAYLYGRASGGDESEKLYRRAIELDPDYYWGNLGLAVQLVSKEPPDTTGAIKYYLKCTRIDDSYPAPFEQLASIYLRKKEFASALKFAELFAVTLPGQFRPVSLKSDVLLAKGDKAKAEEVLTQFAQANSKDQQVRRTLVQMYQKQKRYADAMFYQHQIVDLSGRPADALFELAKLSMMAGEKDSALSYLNHVSTAGFSDYRRLERNPLFDPIRGLPMYTEIVKNLRAAAEKQRQMRLAPLKDSLEAKKREALADKLELVAPLFSLVNLEGKTVSLADLKGKVVVIDFWATWCGPCRQTMPLLQEFVDSKPSDVEFLSINVWERDSSLVRPFLTDYGYQFNVLFGDKEITDLYHVSGIPTLFVIDKEGIIRYKHVGYSPLADQMLTWQTEALL